MSYAAFFYPESIDKVLQQLLTLSPIYVKDYNSHCYDLNDLINVHYFIDTDR